jgi:hypothetical protein
MEKIVYTPRNMKRSLSAIGSISIAALLLAGCGKSTDTANQPSGSESQSGKSEGVVPAATEAAKETAKPVAAEGEKAAIAVKAEGEKTGTATKTEGQKLITDAAKAVTNQVDAVTTQFNNLLTQAKAYVTEKKYQDALNSIQQLSSLKLTPEQQKAVDDLKVQVQKLMASQTVTNILGGFRK